MIFKRVYIAGAAENQVTCVKDMKSVYGNFLIVPRGSIEFHEFIDHCSKPIYGIVVASARTSTKTGEIAKKLNTWYDGTGELVCIPYWSWEAERYTDMDIKFPEKGGSLRKTSLSPEFEVKEILVFDSDNPNGTIDPSTLAEPLAYVTTRQVKYTDDRIANIMDITEALHKCRGRILVTNESYIMKRPDETEKRIRELRERLIDIRKERKNETGTTAGKQVTPDNINRKSGRGGKKKKSSVSTEKVRTVGGHL